MTALGERYQMSYNAEITHLLEMMNVISYIDYTNVHEYIMESVNI